MSSVRVEHKYLLTNEQYLALKRIVQFAFGPQNKLHQKPYPVLSLYYDTKAHEYFYQKINGEHRHIKIRLRKYTESFEDSSPAWLESKIKIDDRITKVRQKHDYQTKLKSPSSWDLSQRRDLLTERAIHHIQPSCYIAYKREAFETMLNTNKLRITFDHHITAFHVFENFEKRKNIFPIGSPKKILLEIKYNTSCYPIFLQDLLKQFSLKRVYFSKYAEGLNILKSLI